jgi:hypothetical protein
MEKTPKRGKELGGEGKGERPLSLVEAQRQEAFDLVMEALSPRLPQELKRSFVSNEKEYALTSAEDCMVAFAQQTPRSVEALHQDIVAQNHYRAEQAMAKLLELFVATNGWSHSMPNFVVTIPARPVMLRRHFRHFCGRQAW